MPAKKDINIMHYFNPLAIRGGVQLPDGLSSGSPQRFPRLLTVACDQRDLRFGPSATSAVLFVLSCFTFSRAGRASKEKNQSVSNT